MFNLAAFLGGLLGGPMGALACWTTLMIPGFLLALGALPFWEIWIRNSPVIQTALFGLNAAAAGLMGGACVVLWQTLIGMSNLRVMLTIGMFGWQFVYQKKVQPWHAIVVSFGIGLVCGEVGVDL